MVSRSAPISVQSTSTWHPAYARMDPPVSAQLLLEIDADAPAGFCEVLLSIGPDSVDGDEVLTPDECVAYLHRFIAHLSAYAHAYEAAMRADADA